MPGTTFKEGVIGQPINFLPTKANNQNDKVISKLVYRGLFDYDILGNLIPDLADTWIVSDDGLVYTIKLKENQKWSNGQKVTSDDLIYTSYKTSDLEGVGTDRVDDLTVRFTLPNKYAPFVNLLTLKVMPKDAEEKNNPLKPVSNGEFIVARIEKSGASIRQVTLLSNKSQHKIKKLVFRYYSDEDQLVTASKLGEIDAFTTSNTYDNLKNFENKRFPLQGIYYAMFFNLENEAVKSVDFRKQLEKTLNIKNLIKTYGIDVQGSISRNSFTLKNSKFDAFDEYFEEDLLGKQVTITIPDTKSHVDLAKEIKDNWEDKLNIDVTIRKVSPSEINEKVLKPKNFEILLFGQEVARDPDRYVLWHSTQKVYPGLNITSFEHVKADRALEEGRNELDDEKRAIHYNAFQEVISQEVPAIFLYHPYLNYYVSKYIKGMGDKYTFTPADRFLDFFNWERYETN